MENLETWLAEENSIIQKEDSEKQVYLYDWLYRLNEYLLSKGSSEQGELKSIQPKIITTLHKIVEINCSPTTRTQLAKCFATVYHTGTTLGLFDSVSKCIDLIKSRDDSPNQLPVKLTAICCMGSIYRKLGRMVGALFDAALQVLLKLIYKAEPHAKCEILLCFENMLHGMGSASKDGHKDICKACKATLIDKCLPVRWAGAKCALELTKHADFMFTSELDSMVSACLRGLEGSNYDVRVQIAQLFGVLMAGSQTHQPPSGVTKGKKTTEDMFNIMASAFLKGGSGFLRNGVESGMNREIRIGVTQAYVVFFREMGSIWVAKHLGEIISHILELVASQKSTSSHIDNVYSRKCISFILNSVLCGMLPESSKIQAIKELCKIILKQIEVIHGLITSENNSELIISNMDVRSTQYVLVCALSELSNLILALTSSIKSIMEEIVDAVFSTLTHPAPAVWLSAAWCIRSCGIALPSNITHLIDQCVKKMKTLRFSADTVAGYGYTLSGIIGGLHMCPLGLPFKKAQAVFIFTEEIFKSASTNSKLLQTGWVLLGSLCTLGPSFAKKNLPSMLDLWMSVFSFEKSDPNVDKGKGNVKTWQLTIENRANALCSMSSFIKHCKSLLVPDVLKKVMIPVESALSFLLQFQMLLKIHGPQLRPAIAMFKSRLYCILLMLPANLFEGFFTPLLRNLAADFTLVDQGSVTTSLLQSLCHKDDNILLGSWVQETDYKDVEEQLQLNSAAGSGALEHDSFCIYSNLSEGEKIPGPLPLGVAVVDAAINLFGKLFPYLPSKHCAQLMNHFNDCIIKNKGARQQAIHTNIFTAFLAALKNLSDSKSSFDDTTTLTHAKTLILEALGNTDNILRCAAGEALGKLAQVMNDRNFVALMAQNSFDKCQKMSDAYVRTGHALSLGCLHRYVGGMESGQHLGNSVSILVALAKDVSSSLVQVWSLHGLTSIADSGGPMFRTYVDQSFFTVIDLMLNTPSSAIEVHHCLGKCVNALITAIGPELQDDSKKMLRTRMFCMSACSIMQNHPDSFVQSESIHCLQQLHLFAPDLVNLSSLVPFLCNILLSPHLLLRKASIECLRQLAHREAKDISQWSKSTIANNPDIVKKMFNANYGLEGLLFSLLDAEVDIYILKHIREIISSLLIALVDKELKSWLSLCKQVVLASNINEEQNENFGSGAGAADEDEEEDGQIVLNSKSNDTPIITPKWPTRVFAMECLRMIIDVCKNYTEHMDLKEARKLKNNENEYLVMQLSELVRMAFIAGTSSNDLLKLEGMKMLQDVVVLFANVPDPDTNNEQLILEQFQAQVDTALRPAFASNVPPDVTAMACEVCSSWIGFGISKNVADVRRIQQLLVNSLVKIGKVDDVNRELYSESAYTLENLAVLKAWAQIYIMAMNNEKELKSSDENISLGCLLDLIKGDLRLLVKHWLNALKDFVILTLPQQYESQLPQQGGVFYSSETADSVRPHYKLCWPPIVHATALWLSSVSFQNSTEVLVGAEHEVKTLNAIDPVKKTIEEVNTDRFYLLSGICVEAMCSPLSLYPVGTIEACASSFNALLSSHFGRCIIGNNKILSIELLTVLHRLLLSRDEPSFQLIVLEIVFKCSTALGESSEPTEDEIVVKKSVLFNILEICCYMVKRYAYSVMPEEIWKSLRTPRKLEFSASIMEVLAFVSSILSGIPKLCTFSSSVVCLPTILFLLSSIFKYIVLNINENFSHESFLRTALTTLTQSFKEVITSPHALHEENKEVWGSLIQSCLLSVLQTANAYTPCDNATHSVIITVWENIMIVVSVFVLFSPSNISNSMLLSSCTNLFSGCIQKAPSKLRLLTLKIVGSIIKSPISCLSIPFIHECIPLVYDILETTHSKRPGSESELLCCKESINLIEFILSIVEEDKRTLVMSVYIPALVPLLYDSTSLGKANSFSRSLHDFCIQRLTATGPLYPISFKTCMANFPELKSKLTEGIKANESVKQKKNIIKGNDVQPQIKLKMDFSNFK
ncbi:HEAT repeat-containing protein 5B isoform X1 [Hydra vulgaris]|uniref:HEAT repeat-containing protein 5B n=1 Tax=Hydra vulgaris TaxID=6087 RepID=T2M3I3_HYDVU|nr:HEAT repeat-containing protein 5B [Hydra vulgaris]